MHVDIVWEVHGVHVRSLAPLPDKIAASDSYSPIVPLVPSAHTVRSVHVSDIPLEVLSVW